MLKNIYLIAGKSGSGKTTVVEQLAFKYGYKILSSYTTRPKRHKNDIDHTYVNISDYMKAKESGDIVASTVFNNQYYWATKDQIESSDLYVIDKNGIENLKECYKGDKRLIIIYIDTDDEECIRRMKIRGDSESAIWSRVKHDADAFHGIERLADFIVDGNKINTWCFIESIISDCERIEV